MNKFAKTILMLLLPGVLAAQTVTQHPVTTPGTHLNIIPMSTANGVIADSNLWDIPVFPNGAGHGVPAFGSMALRT